MQITQLTLTRPDDWHLHLRDGAMLEGVLPESRDFARAIVMPNLKPPVTTTAAALAYRERILAVLDPRLAIADFQPLMTLYLTDATDPGEIARAQASGCVHGVKLYPAGATTNSEAGVTDIRRVHAVLGEMERRGMPLLVHGEVTAPEIDVFDREQVFIDTVLEPLLRDFPGLKVVFEHITTKQAVDFVMAGPAQLAATITPQVTWGTNPAQVTGIDGTVPNADDFDDPTTRETVARALEYMGLTGGTAIRDITVDTVFIGSCTNSRIEDLRAAAEVMRGRAVTAKRVMIVPGSHAVKAAAEAEGLPAVFRAAGADWREPGCSMCLAMNPDKLSPGERCASTSNRNFEGRQGRGGRTHLVSPAVAAATAVAGHFATPADLAPRGA